jgi:hypothetical protein
MFFCITTLVLTFVGGALFYYGFLSADGIRGSSAIKLVAVGAILAAPARLLVSYILDSIGWSLRIGPSVSAKTAWLAAVVVVAAIEHLVLVVVVSPMYRAHRLERLGTAMSAVGLAAVGFGITNSIVTEYINPGVSSLWLGLGFYISSVFSAVLWSSCLSTSHLRYRHYFPLVWLGSVVIDGTVRHGCIARTGWMKYLCGVLLVAMVVTIGLTLRKLQGPRESVVFAQAHRLSLHVDAHRLDGVRAAFQHTNRPALIHWIVGGAFVSFGANLAGLGLGALVARWLSIDLSRIDETSASAAGPLLLVGSFVLLSFPVAGFLTAKASAADSLFEPAMAALISIVALAALLARSAPVSIVLGLAIAPVAFALACVGAWLGQERSAREDASVGIRRK